MFLQDIFSNNIIDEEEILQELIHIIVNIYGDIPVKIILYGFVARGTRTKEPDIDITVMAGAG